MPRAICCIYSEWLDRAAGFELIVTYDIKHFPI